MKFGTRLACFSVACAAFLGAAAASAHVRLIDPPPRLDGEEGVNQLKIGPCGQNNNARTETVTNFMGGETIGVIFGEYINHESYYRIALDVEGDDSFPMRPEEEVQPDGDDPASIHPLSDISDTELEVYILQYYTQDEGSFMQEAEYSTEVTLPNIDCQNCTLQLIQFMYNDEEPHYFQCADITITATSDATTTTTTTTTTTSGAGGTTTTGEPFTTGGMTTSGATGTSGIVPPTTTGAAASTTGTGGPVTVTSGSTSTTGTTGGFTATSGTSAVTGATVTGTGTSTAAAASTTGTTGEPPAQPAEDEGGCSCRTAPGASGGGWLGALLGLGLLGYRRRPKARC